MATREESKRGRDGGREGVQAMERDDALPHNCIVPLPPLTLAETINKQWQPERGSTKGDGEVGVCVCVKARGKGGRRGGSTSSGARR